MKIPSRGFLFGFLVYSYIHIRIQMIFIFGWVNGMSIALHVFWAWILGFFEGMDGWINGFLWDGIQLGFGMAARNA